MNIKMFVTVKSGREVIGFDGINSVSVDENHVTLYIHKRDGKEPKIYQLSGKIIGCFVSYAPFIDNPKLEKYELERA